MLAAEKLRALGPLNFGEKVLTGVFLLTLLLWSTATITNIPAPVVGLLGVAILLGTKTVLWEEVKEEKNAWDTLVWMGALMSLASVLAKLNFFVWFAAIVKDRMHGVPWIPTLGVLLIIYIYTHYGFASLVPHIVAMYTAFGTVAIAAGAPKFLTAMTLAFASNLMMSLTHFAAGPSPDLLWRRLRRPGHLVEAGILCLDHQPHHLGGHRRLVVEAVGTLVDSRELLCMA